MLVVIFLEGFAASYRKIPFRPRLDLRNRRLGLNGTHVFCFTLPLPHPALRPVTRAGNFIIDHVKLIDYYPAEEMLATILQQSSSNGGGPYNVLKNLAKLGAEFPLEAAERLSAGGGCGGPMDHRRLRGPWHRHGSIAGSL